MKSFFISLGLLAFFIAFTIINNCKVGDILNHISYQLSVLPQSHNNYISSETQNTAKDIYDFWKSKSSFLNLTINTTELRDCEIALGDLVDFSKSDTGADYNAALTEAKIRISVLIEREKFSLDNIL